MANNKNKNYVVHYIELQDAGKSSNKGDKIRFAWRAPDDSYPKEIVEKLGVIKVKAEDQTKGLIFGMNHPRPPRIRINYSGKQGKHSSAVLFCSPKNIARVLLGFLKGMSFRGAKITTCSTIGSSTNPSRGKKNNTKRKKKSPPPPKLKRK
ncbi:MAG: hypothetical protein WBF90_37840 [Rivularia sp. (in: cyanobacteria)]